MNAVLNARKHLSACAMTNRMQFTTLIGYAKFRSRSPDAVIRVYDDVGNVIETQGGQRLETFLQTPLSDPLFLAIGYAVGIAFTLLGAYIVARMSRPYPILNTLIFGVISTLLIVFFGSMYPVWYNVLSILTVIPVSLVPGYLFGTPNSLTNRSSQPRKRSSSSHG
jgi:ABC-type Na+ efflux pump permease subunit